jgi:hypothetical protein
MGMTHPVSRSFLAGALFFGGLLAGLDIDRAFIAMPAWERLGPSAWAEYSRHADLGGGLLLYPAAAILGLVFTLAALAGLRGEPGNRKARLLLVLAALLSLGGLAFTLKAAPLMLGIRDLSDPEILRRHFEGFRFWGNLRGACQVPAFLAQIGALAFMNGRKMGP